MLFVLPKFARKRFQNQCSMQSLRLRHNQDCCRIDAKLLHLQKFRIAKFFFRQVKLALTDNRENVSLVASKHFLSIFLILLCG